MFTQAKTTSRHLTGGVILSILIILAATLVALFAPKIAPFDPKRMQAGLSNYPPAWYENGVKPGRPDHLLGTDLFGRDILSRAIHGARSAMFLVILAIPLAVLFGTIAGILAGMGNKFIADLFQRISDIASSVPSFMFAVIIVFILRPTPMGRIYGGLITLTLAFALVNWVSLARLIYTSVITIKQLDFMEASRSLGAGAWPQVFKHILPHVSHLIITWAIINIPAVILLEALFGYIGVEILRVTDGSSFQDISWGGLILSGRTMWNYNPFVLLLPTLFILVISVSFATLGEYLNERMNPKFKSNQII